MGWECRFKSNLGENKEGSKRCGRRIWMISGVPCMAGYVLLEGCCGRHAQWLYSETVFKSPKQDGSVGTVSAVKV